MTGETTDNVAVQNAGLDGTIKQGVSQNMRQYDRIGFPVVFFGRGGGTRGFELRGRTWWGGEDGVNASMGKCQGAATGGASSAVHERKRKLQCTYQMRITTSH